MKNIEIVNECVCCSIHCVHCPNERVEHEYLSCDLCGKRVEDLNLTERGQELCEECFNEWIKTDYIGKDQLLPAYNVQAGVAD